MAKISAVIITRNEEDKLYKCISALKGWTDEIIVVDDHSSDATVHIANDLGVRVMINSLNNDFARQRNFGAGAALNEWVLSLDADEVISPAAARKITAAVDAAGDQAAFSIGRRNFILDEPLEFGGSRTTVTRLYKKSEASFAGAVHEQLVFKGRAGAIDAAIDHYPLRSIAKMIDKINRYTSIEAKGYVARQSGVPAKEIGYRLTIKPINIFLKLYLKKQGRKDGLPGLVWCVVNVVGSMIKWVKIWEEAKRQDKLRVK